MMKEKSNGKKIKKLEHQYFRHEGNPEAQRKIQGRIDTLKNQK